MRKKVLPVIVSTREALETALPEGPHVIYVDRTLYSRDSAWVRAKAQIYGYTPGAEGVRGTFFLRTGGDDPFDPERHEIHDPQGIL